MDYAYPSNFVMVSTSNLIDLLQILLQVMQKMGRSEQTKDEVYTEFVVNFNKQQVGVVDGCGYI